MFFYLLFALHDLEPVVGEPDRAEQHGRRDRDPHEHVP